MNDSASSTSVVARRLLQSVRMQAYLKPLTYHRTWKRGDVLLHAGEIAQSAFRVDEGKVRVSRTTRTGAEELRRGGSSGQLIGLTSVIAQRPFHFSVVAEGSCRTTHYAAQDLLAAMRADGHFALELAALLAQRIQEIEDTALDAREERLIARIHSLLQYLKKIGEGKVINDGFELRISQYDLACMLGSTRQYVNPQLHRLQQQGIIRLGYRRILLLD